MQNAHLGRAGLLVSKLCLGTMNFGAQATEELSHQIMDKALESGLFFFDTANGYGGKRFEGYTEQILGRWFAQNQKARRDRVVLATKVYGTMGEGPNDRRVSAYQIRAGCDASLRRLQTDHIDLYQMHHIDRETPWEEIWQAMEQLVRQGKVLYVGSSNFAGWNIAQANEQARSRNFMGLVSEQSLYNLTQRSCELEVLPACRHYGVGFIPYSPLAGGLLGGVLKDRGTGRRAAERMKGEIEKRRPALEKWEALAAQMGEEPANLALAWLLHQPGMTAPIIGPRTIEQLTTQLRAVEIKLDAEVLKKIDEIWPGPGNQAPEAYAW